MSAAEAQERLSQAFVHLEWAEALHAEAKARVEQLKESLMLAEANVVGTRDLVREAQDNIGFWADELSEALAARPRIRATRA